MAYFYTFCIYETFPPQKLNRSLMYLDEFVAEERCAVCMFGCPHEIGLKDVNVAIFVTNHLLVMTYMTLGAKLIW